MKILTAVAGFVFLFSLNACQYNNEQDLYGACNTRVTVSYSQDIIPILTNNCLGCHSESEKQGGIVLEGYAKVKIFVDNGSLEGVVNHLNGYSPMPKSADKLPECTLESINSWINNGAPNN